MTTKTTAPVKTLRLFLKYGPHGEKLMARGSLSMFALSGRIADSPSAN
jgi:hypothetical protein